MSRSGIVNPKDSRRSIFITVVSDSVSDSLDYTNSHIFGDTRPMRDSVLRAKILAIFRETWESERIFPSDGDDGVILFFVDWQSDLFYHRYDRKPLLDM